MDDSYFEKSKEINSWKGKNKVKLIDNRDGTHSISVGATTSNPLAVQSVDPMQRVGLNSTFGEAVVGTRQNNINIPFVYNNGNGGIEENMNITKFLSSGTGFQTNENETCFMHTGTGIGYAENRSKNTNRYVTGHGNDVFHTFVFPDVGEANTYSWLGYGSLKMNDCIGFGKKDNVFGIWLKLRGSSLEDSFVPQSEWNIDTLPEYVNGNGLISGNSFGWLGYADIDLFVMLDNNQIVHVHKYKANNTNQVPHISDPTMPISVGCERTSGAGADIKNGTSSWFAGTVGNRATGTGQDRFPFVKRRAVSVPANTETVLLSIRNKEEFAGKPNNLRLRYGTVTITSDGNKTVEFNVYLNGVRYDPNVDEWGDYDANASITEMNLDAPLQLASRSIVAGLDKVNQQIGGTYLGKIDRDRINLFSRDVIIAANAGDIITFTALSSGATEVDFELRHIEEN